MECKCNYHLGMGPNLKCPVHGEHGVSASFSNELLCGLREKFSENAEQFDSLMVEMLAKNDRLLVLATKHCPQDHHDWDEILKLANT